MADENPSKRSGDDSDSGSESAVWHARSAERVVTQFGVDPDRGLDADTAAERLDRYGANRLQEAQRRGSLRILVDQFRSIVIIILVVAAVLAFATGRLPEGFALVGVTVVNTLIGFFTEWKAVRSMEALRKLSRQKTTVRRGGDEQRIGAEGLVPGDIVMLREEELAPADVRLLDCEQLRVGEAALTGESVPVLKTPEPVAAETPLAERTNMVYKGTTIAEGSGTGVVVATGMETELGQISKLAAEAEEAATPLQRRLDALGRRLAWITLTIAAVVAVAGLAAGRDFVLMIETALALGVAAVPEGLPIVATMALARGMWLMSRHNALVNRLTAVETLGATRVIFTDKTGTLTENRMSVRRAVTALDEYDLDPDAGDEAQREASTDLARCIRIGVLCNNAALRSDPDESDRGDPTEVALLEAGVPFGMRRDQLLESMPEEHEVSFDPEVMMMATYHRDSEGLFAAVKGSPEAVFGACTSVVGRDGDESMDDETRERWREITDRLANEGLRVLAMADKPLDDPSAEPFTNLRFVGLVGMVDPPRHDIRDAIAECQGAGMRVVMVTGDRPDTGRAIGEQVGLSHDGSAVHGNELADWEHLSPKDRHRMHDASVFARVTPEQKLNLVKLYQDQGEIVAMTGDGVNDAPALKQADIGVAMGLRGTDAAKQMADMVLRDDRFATIVEAVRQGRVIFANIRKSVVFMLCTNLAEILAVTVASLIQLPIPLRPLQILYLNVLTDVFPALALGIGKGSVDVMRQPPRDPDEPVLTRHHWTAIGGWSVVIGACVLGALLLAMYWIGLDEMTAVTISFLTLGFAKLWFVLNLRGRGAPPHRNDVVKNPWIWASLVFCSLLLALAVYWPALSGVLDTRPPGGAGWALILGSSFVPAILGLVVPGIRFHTVAERQRRSDPQSTGPSDQQAPQG